jgi:hypothetical protein
LLVGGARGSFDASGALTDDTLQERLHGWLNGFFEFCGH